MKQRLVLPKDKWLWADEEQMIRRYINETEWVDCKLLTRDEWEQLQVTVSARKQASTERAASLRGPWLTGLVFCSKGRPTICRQDYYACDCRERVDPHKGSGISQPKFEHAVKEIIKAIIEGLPVELMQPEKVKADTKHELRLELNLLLKQQRELMTMREGYMGERGQFILRVYGKDELEHKASESQRKLDNVTEEIVRVQACLAQPDLSAIVPTLFAIQAVGFDAVWKEMDAPDRKVLSRQFLQRVEIIVPPNRYVEQIRVKTQVWVGNYCSVPDLWDLPKKVFRRTE